jgi:transketolase
MHTVKPLDEALLAKLLADFPLVATLEEHSRCGGLGGAVAEWLADHPSRARLIRIGTADEFLHEAGDQTHARRHFGLDPESVVEKIVTASGPQEQ